VFDMLTDDGFFQAEQKVINDVTAMKLNSAVYRLLIAAKIAKNNEKPQKQPMTAN